MSVLYICVLYFCFVDKIVFVLCCAVLSCFSRVQLFVTLWAVASQAPLSMDNFPGVVGISFSRVSSSPRYWTCVYTNLFQILHICVNIQYLFFSFWLTSLCMTNSRSIHVSTNDSLSEPSHHAVRESPSGLWENMWREKETLSHSPNWASSNQPSQTCQLCGCHIGNESSRAQSICSNRWYLEQRQAGLTSSVHITNLWIV